MKKLFILACICICTSAFAQAQKTIVISPLGEPASPANRPTCVPVKETFVGGCCVRWNVVCDNGIVWYGKKICDFECQLQYAFEKAMGIYLGENGTPTSENPHPVKVPLELRFVEGTPEKIIEQKSQFIEYTELCLTENFKITTEAGITYVYMAGTYIIRNSEVNVTYFYR